MSTDLLNSLGTLAAIAFVLFLVGGIPFLMWIGDKQEKRKTKKSTPVGFEEFKRTIPNVPTRKK